MIAAAPHYNVLTGENRDLEYLLLGDLRQLLEEPVNQHTSRWLLAILDVLLVGRPVVRSMAERVTVHSNGNPCGSRNLETGMLMENGSLLEKLRRLRDRVAHCSGHTAIANEIREELREVMRDRMSSAACVFDA